MEAACASHFLELDSSTIRFCRFDLKSRCYYEVTAPELRDSLSVARSGPGPVSNGREVISAEERLKRRLASTLRSIPGRFGAAIFNYAASRREAYHAAVRAYREIITTIRVLLPHWARPHHPASPRGIEASIRVAEPLFKPADVYISLGLDWDSKDYQFLYSLKKDVGFKVLLICYDVIPVEHQQLFFGASASLFGRHFADLAWTADEILCISECTRRDLTRLLIELGTPLPPRSVVPLGCELPADLEGELSETVRETAHQGFILFVSTIERRKNHEVLYRAYTRMVDEGKLDLPLLVFVGMPGWGVAELFSDLQLDKRIRPYVRLLHQVSDVDLDYLYRKAQFTVFPSLYEGWGLPVAESLAYGKFCLASNAASIPEVGGDLVEYLDPWDLPAWKSRLEWYFDHPEDVARKAERIGREFRLVPWSHTAECVLTTARRLAQDNA
jgi:glycosyltransferase involved in cell wall biosynthesis